jgi:transcriptional regulator with XRE-family HTH domain
VVLLRQEIGDVLRDARRRQGRTLREVSSVARVSLGYLSEVERGQKEASSELLASICGALDVPLASVLHTVSRRVAQTERVEPQDLDDTQVQVPDTVPDGLAPGVTLRDGLVSAVVRLPLRGARRPGDTGRSAIMGSVTAGGARAAGYGGVTRTGRAGGPHGP